MVAPSASSAAAPARWLSALPALLALLGACPTCSGVPDFVIAGAMKAGTTDFAKDVLGPNPAVRLSQHEIHYLTDCAPKERVACPGVHIHHRHWVGPWVWYSNGSVVRGEEGGHKPPWWKLMPPGDSEVRNFLDPDDMNEDASNCTSEKWHSWLPKVKHDGQLVGDKTPSYMRYPNVRRFVNVPSSCGSGALRC
jgi:hypothetical protein